ncbi:MAG: Rrf2 family transcriptional regulator [Armatimonadetes bacterium]|nr:Rrf2 family transcriptional regulator [Armatimonadota bacterium]
MLRLLNLSRECEYAFRAMACLAERGEGTVVPLRTIAREQRLPESYLYKVFYDLKKSGLVRVQRGASRGFLLAKGPERITLLDIVTACDGPIDTGHCVLDSGRPCDFPTSCPLHCGWDPLIREAESTLSKTTLCDLVGFFGEETGSRAIIEQKTKLPAKGRKAKPVPRLT